jgi:hypothetical protein
MSVFKGSIRGGWSTAFSIIVWVSSLSHGSWAGEHDVTGQRNPAPIKHGSSPVVQSMARWVVSSEDNQNLPFVVVDKISAMLHVYDAAGKPRASTSVLLGQAVGDHSVPDIGKRRIADIRPAERTTPAGRFVGEPGKNVEGENIVWIDYDAALAIHRVRPGRAYQQHLKQLASGSPAVKRASYGCVVVPVHFFEQVISPTFAGGKAVIYILPEQRSAAELFDGAHL